MPWNDQSGNGGGQRPSGGPWGDGPRQPWGPPRSPQPPPGGGGGGQDMDDLMRKWQERMRGSFGGGRGSGGDGKGIGGAGLGIIGALAALVWVGSGFYIVDTGQLGVVTRFGAMERVSQPGAHLHLPFPIESVRVENVTLQRREQIGLRDGQERSAESLMLTGDRAIVDIGFTVTWNLKDVEDFVFNIRNQDELVFAISESAMREVVGKRTIEGIITRDRAAVEEDVRKLMQATLDQYQSGVQISQVQIQKADAPTQVIDAFNDVVRAGADAETKINEATKYKNEVEPQARGEAARMLQEAEAYKERVVREATGEAERFRLIQEQYRTAPRVTRDRLYLETMERVFGGADKIIIDQRAGVNPILPLDRLRSGAGAAAPAPAAPAPQAAPRGGQ